MKGISENTPIRIMPWEQIGIDNSSQTNIIDVLKNSKLDYENELIEVFDKDGNQFKGFYAITRSDQKGIAHGFVKNRYKLPQNKTEFEFFDKFIKESKSNYGFAGSLWDSEIVWFFARTNDVIKINNEEIRIYALLTIYQTGKHSKQVTFIPIREACNNVLISPIQSVPNNFNIPNKKSLIEDQENIEMILELKEAYVDELSKIYQSMIDRKVNQKEEKAFFEKVVSGSGNEDVFNKSGTFTNRIANMSDFYKNHFTQQTITGSAFGLLNAVTGYYMNIKEYSSPEKRFNNIYLAGDAYSAAETAFRTAKYLLKSNN